MMDIKKLEKVLPSGVYSQLPAIMSKFSINTPLRLCHFLAQVAHESGNFTTTVENLNYSEERLKEVFSKYFPGNMAKEYAKNPQKIGSRVYANRMGNGNEASGDGYKYRGRGYLQCTGKEQYKLLSDDFGVDFVTNPDLLATKYPLSSAAWFFKKNNLLALCDGGADVKTITTITKKVNGGIIGLKERIEKFNQYYDIMT